VTVCEAHQECFREVYDTIKEVPTKAHAIWTVGVLSSVAIFYGVTLWTSVSGQCTEQAARIHKIEQESAVRQVKLEYIEKTCTELKSGQEEMKREMNRRFDELRREIQRLSNDKRLLSTGDK